MPIPQIDPVDLKARLDAGEDLLVVDVRLPWELEISSVDFAKHIILDELPNRLDEIPHDKTVVLICRSGNRSQMAGDFLVSKGYDRDKLLNLEGGILAWAQEVDDNLPQFY